jgi:hypothetical protein
MLNKRLTCQKRKNFQSHYNVSLATTLHKWYETAETTVSYLKVLVGRKNFQSHYNVSLATTLHKW